MKKQSAIIFAIMMMVTTIYALSLGNIGYSQQQGESSILDSINVKNSNLTLGKPSTLKNLNFHQVKMPETPRIMVLLLVPSTHLRVMEL